MAGSLTVRQARLVLPDRVVTGDLVVEDGVVSEIGPRVARAVGLQVDGRGTVVLPGLVDTHVEADDADALVHLAGAALAGGVTSLLSVGAPGTLEVAVHVGFYARADGPAPGAERARGLWVPGELLCSDDADALFASAEKLLVVDNTD